jgi:hypothetical protein
VIVRFLEASLLRALTGATRVKLVCVAVAPRSQPGMRESSGMFKDVGHESSGPLHPCTLPSRQ